MFKLIPHLFVTTICVLKINAQYLYKPFERVDSNYVSLPSRLNTTVKPLSYTIRMRPLIQNDTAPSEVTIMVESISNGSCNVIVLNQKGLNIYQDRVTVTNLRTGRNMSLASQGTPTNYMNLKVISLPHFESAKYLYYIELEESFQLGDRMEIFIPYSVPISHNEKDVGMFKRTHTGETSNETYLRYLSATKLWPFHAKSVFPCFDDPSLKATFKIIIGRLDGQYHSLSNMEIAKTEPDTEHDGWVWDHYKESVKMSPYLVCMIVSGFYNETVLINNGTRSVSTWAPKNDIELGETSFGTRTVARTLQYFEKRFNMSYPLRKLDSVVVSQYPGGATENFGLVAYRPNNFIWVPGKNTEAERRNVALTISHETSHQWFGNVITCASWEDIWLNEGFAKYLQYWGMSETIPEFEPADSFVNEATQRAMQADQQTDFALKMLNKYHPTLVYDKGASILKMMEGFLTRDIFEAGIIDVYLQKMKWKSVHQDDLFEAIQEAVETHNATIFLPKGATVKDVMSGWTLTSGFPLVRVNTIDRQTIQISQEKFNVAAIKHDDVEKGSWWIPIKIISGSSLSYSENFWLPKNISTMNYTSSNIDTTKLLMVNPDATGYFRVLYDENLSNLIAKQLLNNHSVISSSSRSQLLDDYFNLSFANYTSIETALELTRYLWKELSSNVWTAVLHHLNPIVNIFTQSKGALEAFKLKNYFLSRIESALGMIGVRQPEGQRGINVTLRAQLLEIACQLRLPACMEYASELISKWEAHPQNNPFPLDIRRPLYCAAVEGSSDGKAFEFLRQRYFIAVKENREDAVELATALACTKNNNFKWTLKE